MAKTTSKRTQNKSSAAPARPPKKAAAAQGVAGEAHLRVAVPVVGIGASAGGLEALDAFLRNVPKNSGLAYVVVQHLDPTRKGMLTELLQHATAMPVVQVKDLQPIEPDHVYVIPPNRDLSLLHGKLHLLPRAKPTGMSLPIDFFFRTLAEDQQEWAIGVLLSGMGSDGTLGLRAIKEKAGAVFVQAPKSAKFDSMPRSAIDAGLADVVAPVEELPQRIVAYRRHAPFARRGSAIDEHAPGPVEKIFVLLRSQTGNDFSLYKRTTIYRRVERRMGLHQIGKLEQYVRYLRENPGEVELLFKELLIGVTSFFRDPAAWDHLRNDVLPSLITARTTGGVLRAWVTGCSTGEEAYSLAMTFKEAAERLRPGKHVSLQIFATDLDRQAIERARQGSYPDNIVADVSPERLRRFFVQDEHGYRVSKEIREMVVFAPQNVIMDPPFTKLDLLSCRNLLIYLSAELQKRLLPLFHYSLNPGGVLFLGGAETIGGFSGLFSPLDGKSRIYKRVDHAPAALGLGFSSGASASGEDGAEAGVVERPLMPGPQPPSLERLADRVLVQRFAPVGVLCNDRGDVLYLSGRAGRYLEPAVGKANLNIFAMAREGLRYELSGAFSKATRSNDPVLVRGIKVDAENSAPRINLTVQKLTEPRELRGTVMVIMAEVTASALEKKGRRGQRAATTPRLADLEQELRQAREEAQTMREEMQSSQEELKSTNEELQSTNEELQSSNEELTTSKEEMQSLNEELQTVNHELEAKVDELSRANNDMKNLLNSTDIATLFLDAELHVRRFTTPTAHIIKLIPSDAGRPVTDIASDLDYPELASDAREVLRTLVFKEKQVTTHDGRWFLVRIMPYRTLENVIDGVVITFTDASASQALESNLREQAGQLRQMAESLPNLIMSCRQDGACDFVSRQWVEFTGVPDHDHLGSRWFEQVQLDDREALRDAWRSALKDGRGFDAQFRLRRVTGEHRWFKARWVPIRDTRGVIVKWYGSATDVDELKHGEQSREAGVEALTEVLDKSSEGYIALDEARSIVFVNAAAEALFGGKRSSWVGKRLLEAFPEARGTVLETKVDEALRDRTNVQLTELLDFKPFSARYSVRVYPGRAPALTSLFFRRSEAQA